MDAMVTDGADVVDPVRLMLSVVVDVASIQHESFRYRNSQQARDESRSATLMLYMDGSDVMDTGCLMFFMVVY